jgi:hypothetical protein
MTALAFKKREIEKPISRERPRTSAQDALGAFFRGRSQLKKTFQGEERMGITADQARLAKL